MFGYKRHFFVIYLIALTMHACNADDTYLLTSPSYNPGLFSVFHTVIGSLDAYEKEKWTGLTVDFKDQGNYYDKAHGPNWWQYYFEPINIGYFDEAKAKKFPTYKKVAFSYMGEFLLPRTRVYELIQKYIRLKPHMQKKIDTYYTHHFAGCYVIGVHYRGTDKVSEASHVSYHEAYKYIQCAVHTLSDKKNIRVFIATDDANFFQFIKKTFPGKAFGMNAIRSYDDKTVHHNTKGQRYKRGEDAIIDCILLSKCQLLIKTASNLSDCSMGFNPDIPVIHLNRSNNE